MNFGKSLQRHREAAGLSQTELALRSHTPIDSLRNWEQGKVLPRIDSVVRLAQTIGVTVDAIVAGVEFTPPGEEASPRRGRPRKPEPAPAVEASDQGKRATRKKKERKE